VEAAARQGSYRSAGELAEAAGVTRTFINRMLRLTLLAADIEVIFEGRPGKVTTVQDLTQAVPSAWTEQRDIIGVPHRSSA
jgi:hypothetical protein